MPLCDDYCLTLPPVAECVVTGYREVVVPWPWRVSRQWALFVERDFGEYDRPTRGIDAAGLISQPPQLNTRPALCRSRGFLISLRPTRPPPAADGGEAYHDFTAICSAVLQRRLMTAVRLHSVRLNCHHIRPSYWLQHAVRDALCRLTLELAQWLASFGSFMTVCRHWLTLPLMCSTSYCFQTSQLSVVTCL